MKIISIMMQYKSEYKQKEDATAKDERITELVE